MDKNFDIINKLKKFIDKQSFKRLYICEKSAPSINQINVSNLSHRLAIPMKGFHQMEIPSGNGIRLINPKAGDLVWMPMGSWNKPSWLKKVDTITLLFNENYIQVNNAIVCDVEKERKRTSNRIQLNKNSPLQLYLNLLSNHELEMSGLLHLLISFIITYTSTYNLNYELNSFSHSSKLYKSIHIWLNEHAFEKINRTVAAKEFKISESHLSRIFKQNSKQTFNDTLTEIRVEFSKKLLIQNRHSISEISEIIGFNDSNYFSRVFKKVTSKCPMDWEN